jgi:outer membrane protein W
MVCSSISFLAGGQAVSLGPNVGFGSTWIDNFKDNKQFKSSTNFGASLIYSTKSSFGVGVDVKYSFEGGERKYQSAVAGVMTEEDVNLQYIRVPVKAMWFFGKYGNRVRPKISLGPSIGVLVGGKTHVRNMTNAGALISELAAVNSKDNWDRYDVGLTGAAGINFRIVSRTWLNADVAYLHGLTDNRRDDRKNVAGYTPGTNYKNRNLVLNLGLNFGL